MRYAEYLTRLNSISVVVDFHNDKIQDITNIGLSSPQKLTIKTKSNTMEVTLPVPIHGHPKLSNLRLDTGKCLSLTINLEESPDQKRAQLATSQSFMFQYNTKWSCKDLQNKTPRGGTLGNANEFSFRCIGCNATIINSVDYKFQDMPSEFWYELMDFWHCHKPENNQHHEKSYEGSLKLANDEMVIIGNHYLLVNKCSGVVISHGEEVNCAQCGTFLGAVYQNTLRLLKWRLSLEYNVDGIPKIEKFPSYLFIYNTFIDKINSLATRKFMFSHKGKQWFFWVMNVSLDIAINETALKNTLKILYYSDNDDVPITDDESSFYN
ncbi:ubiquitin-conjugating enzyme E2-binding protein [Scheffersomyces xylosifermentans]|uniref:ubiquitin-conjugating enzyme E2-binding protein n=1 Tax=Scheffersomyces xylosifermentans TaxID=1304137 RepID=UPI00315CA874